MKVLLRAHDHKCGSCPSSVDLLPISVRKVSVSGLFEPANKRKLVP